MLHRCKENKAVVGSGWCNSSEHAHFKQVRARTVFIFKQSCNRCILLRGPPSPFCFCQDFVVDLGADGICIVATITVLYYGHLCIRQYRDLPAASSDGAHNSCKWYFSDLENFISAGLVAGIPQQCLRVLSGAHLQTWTTLGLYTRNTQTRAVTIAVRLQRSHMTSPDPSHTKTLINAFDLFIKELFLTEEQRASAPSFTDTTAVNSWPDDTHIVKEMMWFHSFVCKPEDTGLSKLKSLFSTKKKIKTLGCQHNTW